MGNERRDRSGGIPQEYQEILKKLEKVEAFLRKYAEKQGDDPGNWGIVGDIAYYSENLDNILGNS